MVRLRDLGWGTRRIAAELGCHRETVQRYLAAGGWAPYHAPRRPGVLAGHEAWLTERLRRHRGNADVVRQELAAELGIVASLRTVERAVAFRPELTNWPSDTHKGTEQERAPCRKTIPRWFPFSSPFRQGLPYRNSAHFRLLRAAVSRCWESSVFRYVTDETKKFPYAYQKASSSVLANALIA